MAPPRGRPRSRLLGLFALSIGIVLSLCVRTSSAQCPAVTAWPAPGNPITALIPTSIYEGSVKTVRVTGAVDSSWTLQICPKSATPVSQNNLPTAKSDTSSSSVIQALVTANPGSAGDYAILVVDPAGAAHDSGKTLTIATSDDDTKYVSCAAPATRPKPNANLGCSFVPFSYETTYAVFGKGVANRFIAVQVTIRNKNSNLEYLLQDVRVGQPGFILSSYDKKIPRAVSEKAEQFSARAIIIRLTSAAASIVTGVAGFAGSEILQDAANIFAGPAQTGLQNAIPNLSAAELTRMDDLGFSTTSTVIPKNGAIAVVAFIPSDTVEPAVPTSSHWYRSTPNSYSTYRGGKLEAFFTSLAVSVAGTHVQEANPSQPTLKLFIPNNGNTVQLSALRTGPNATPITIQGSGLDGVTQVQLSNTTDGKTVIPAKLQPLAGESAVDPNVAVLSIPSAVAATVGVYDISFILADGTTVKTGQNISVLPGALTLSVPDAAIGATVTITGVGFGASQGTSTVTYAGIPAVPVAWTSDTSLVMTVPPAAPASGNIIVSVSGVSSNPVPFKVP
jgi:hypothetical protein